MRNSREPDSSGNCCPSGSTAMMLPLIVIVGPSSASDAPFVPDACPVVSALVEPPLRRREFEDERFLPDPISEGSRPFPLVAELRLPESEDVPEPPVELPVFGSDPPGLREPLAPDLVVILPDKFRPSPWPTASIRSSVLLRPLFPWRDSPGESEFRVDSRWDRELFSKPVEGSPFSEPPPKRRIVAPPARQSVRQNEAIMMRGDTWGSFRESSLLRSWAAFSHLILPRYAESVR